MTQEDHYRYLGVPIGLFHNVTQLETLVDELTSKLNKIENSLLAPWQKLDANDPTIKSLQAYRSQLIATIRSICSLPTRATTHYIFASKRSGALAFTDPCVENHLQTIVQAIKMLSSSDPSMSTVAKRELRQTVRFAAQADPTPSLVSCFHSNTPDRRLETIRYRTGSLWTRTRRSTKHLNVSFNVPDSGVPSISAPDYADPVMAKARAVSFTTSVVIPLPNNSPNFGIKARLPVRSLRTNSQMPLTGNLLASTSGSRTGASSTEHD